MTDTRKPFANIDLAPMFPARGVPGHMVGTLGINDAKDADGPGRIPGSSELTLIVNPNWSAVGEDRHRLFYGDLYITPPGMAERLKLAGVKIVVNKTNGRERISGCSYESVQVGDTLCVPANTWFTGWLENKWRGVDDEHNPFCRFVLSNWGDGEARVDEPSTDDPFAVAASGSNAAEAGGTTDGPAAADDDFDDDIPF